MRNLPSFLFSSVFITVVNATSTSNSSLLNPCAILSNKYAAQIRAGSDSPNFLPSEVYACQQDVPINKTLAVQQIKWMRNFWQFQSTLAFLKNPPAAYPMPGTDLLGGLDHIEEKAASDQYQNEYDFELDIYNLAGSTNDGHFAYQPWLTNNFFTGSKNNLVSVSLDGVEEPKVYFLSDIQAKYRWNASFTPSAISTINSEDVNTRAISQPNGFQDYDALFNSMFSGPVANPGQGTTIGGFYGLPSYYHNDTVVYQFENDTKRILPNYAWMSSKTVLDFSSGRELFEKYLLNTPQPSNASSTPSTPTPTPQPKPKPTVPGYPVPVPGTKHPKDLVSGYFFKEAGYSDLAVLAIPSFDAETGQDQIDFQNGVQTFLAACRTSGKQRLIIDVRQNPGGTIAVGYDTFKQLFPSVVPYSGMRIRAHDAADVIGLGDSKYISLIEQTHDIAQLIPKYEGKGWDPFFNGGYLESPDSHVFPSWTDFYGPVQSHGDNFTHVGSWPFSSQIYTGSIVVSGYGNRSHLPPQAFTSSNIILLMDGDCSSTCTVFSTGLVNQGNVTTVVAGGRPNRDPMALIGGVRGAQVMEYSTLADWASLAQLAAQLSNDTDAIATANRLLGPLMDPPPIQPVDAGSSSINLRDNIAQGDASLTPLQFTAGPYADCRFFYTPHDMLNVTWTWGRVAKGIAAGGKGFCVNGTIGNNTSSSYSSDPSSASHKSGNSTGSSPSSSGLTPRPGLNTSSPLPYHVQPANPNAGSELLTPSMVTLFLMFSTISYLFVILF